VPGEAISMVDVEEAAARIRPHVVRTPVVRLSIPGEVYAKLESLQRTGSFKFRGALNALSVLPAEHRRRGVVADSSGNHGQGVAAAAKVFGTPVTVVIPEGAEASKVAAVEALGAHIVRSAPGSLERARVARRLCDEDQRDYVAPFDDPRVIAGQGTVVVELACDLGRVDTVVVPVGGGGLISGVAIAAKSAWPGVKVIGVEPEWAADAGESFRTGKRVSWPAREVARTICDGARAQTIGELTFDVIRRLVDEMVTVSDDAVTEAVRWYARHARVVVEPTGALTLAAVAAGAVKRSGRVVLIASGGNVSAARLAGILDSGVGGKTRSSESV
jgi:threonine dehydratase